jgi:hypothetical protein
VAPYYGMFTGGVGVIGVLPSMTTELWKIGSVPSYVDVGLGTKINSLVNLNAVVCSNTSTPLQASGGDIYMDISFVLGSITAGGGAPSVDWFLFAQNEDGSFGDGRAWTTAGGITAQPPTEYQIWSSSYPASTAIILTGTIREVRVPPLTPFYLVIYNQSGANLASSGNAVQYKFYNRSMQ